MQIHVIFREIHVRCGGGEICAFIGMMSCRDNVREKKSEIKKEPVRVHRGSLSVCGLKIYPMLFHTEHLAIFVASLMEIIIFNG